MIKKLMIFVLMLLLLPVALALTHTDFISMWGLNNADTSRWVFDANATNNGVLSGKTFNHGVVSGAVRVPSKNSTYGSAMSFDGVDDYVNIGDINLNTNFTISFWFYRTSTVDGEVMYKVNEFLVRSTSSRISCMYSSSYTSSNTGIFNNNEWVYITCIYNGSKIISYKDGLYQSASTVAAKSDTSNNFYMGKNLFALGFNGSLDGVRIWNRALSVSEIQDEMKSGVPVHNNGLIASYEFDYDYNTTIVTEEKFSDFFGGNDDIEEFQAVRFTPTLSGYINNVSLELSKLNTGGAINISLYNDDSGKPGQRLTNEYHVGTGDIGAEAFYNYVFNNPIRVTQGQQYWIVVKNETFSTTNRMNWIMGLGATNQAAYSITGGKTWVNETYTRNHNFTIYNYNNTNLSTLARDTNHLTKATYQTPAGKAFYFDGVNDYVNIPYDITTSAITISAWIKTTTTAKGRIIDSSLPMDLVIEANGKVALDITAGAGLKSSYSTNSLNDGEWHHIVARYNGTSQSLFINNKYDISSYQTQTGTVDIGANIKIGARQSLANQFFNGSLSDIRIYDRALDDQEIKAVYFEGLDLNPGYLQYNASSILNGSPIRSFNVTITASNSTTYQYTETNYNLSVALPSSSYSILTDSDTYALVNATDSFLISANTTSYEGIELYNNNVLNMTFYDETTNSKLVGVNISVQLLSDTQNYQYYTNTSNLYVDRIVPENYTISYTAVDYASNTYVYNVENRSVNTLSLYLLNETSGSSILATVYDESGRVLSSAVVRIYRKDVITGTYTLKYVKTTNSQGQFGFYGILYDIYYKFIIEYPEGTTRAIYPNEQLTSVTPIFIIDLSDRILTDYNNINNVYGNLTFSNATKVFKFDYYDNSGNLEQVIMRVYRVTDSGETLFNTSTTNSQSGLLTVGVNNIPGSKWRVNVYVKFAKEQFWGSLLTEYGTENIFAGDKAMWWWVAILTILVCTVAYLSVELMLVMVPIPTLLFTIIGLIDIGIQGIGIMIGIEIVMIILAYMVSKR